MNLINGRNTKVQKRWCNCFPNEIWYKHCSHVQFAQHCWALKVCNIWNKFQTSSLHICLATCRIAICKICANCESLACFSINSYFKTKLCKKTFLQRQLLSRPVCSKHVHWSKGVSNESHVTDNMSWWSTSCLTSVAVTAKYLEFKIKKKVWWEASNLNI